MKVKARLLAATLLSALLFSGCGDDNNVTFSPGGGGNAPVVVAPVARADAYASRANAQVTTTAANGVLANDTPNGGVIANVGAIQTGHGNVTLNLDGSFTYTPVTGYLGADTFSYTLHNTAGNSTANVTLTLAGTAFYVNNQAVPGGDGSQARPFQTLAQAAAAAAGVNGAQIVVFRGDGTSTGYNTPVTLSSGQSLVGFSAAAQPVLTGPIVFTTGNALANLKIFGPTGVAVNATGASNGTIQGVTIANDTAAVETVALDNATGTFVVANCTLQNLAGSAFFSNSTTGGLVWSVSNSTFTNVSVFSVCDLLRGTSAHNLTVSNSQMSGGAGKGVVTDANTTATNVALTLSNTTVSGGGTLIRGLDVLTGGTTAFTAILSGNNITGSTDNGMLVDVRGASSAKLDFKNNRVVGNASPNGDLEVVNGDTATIGALFDSNIAGNFTFNQAGGVFSIEQFASFSSRNTGTLNVFGTITDAPAGSLGIP